MKKHLILLLVLIVIKHSCAQPIIQNAEDFDIGTVLQFQKCDPEGINAGGSGENQTWDFSNLISLAETSTEWMLDPSSTTNGYLFPTSNLVVKVSNGQFTYVNKTIDENNIVGFIDTTSSYPATQYTNPMIIAKRPLYYGVVVTDTFMLSGSPSIGIVTLEPDAYGTLILPNGTHNNTLRVKITQIHPWFSYTLYVWFDGITKSALLKIDNQPYVEYLLSETVVGFPEINRKGAFDFYPNPARNNLVFESETKGTLIIANHFGQVLTRASIEGRQTNISTESLDPGVYFLIFKADHNIITSRKLIIYK